MKINDRVFSSFGPKPDQNGHNGTIIGIYDTNNYPIHVLYDGLKKCDTFTGDRKLHNFYSYPSLFENTKTYQNFQEDVRDEQALSRTFQKDDDW